MASAVKDSKSNIDPSPLRGAALIVNGNLVEHYEIATYGSLVSFAKNLGPAKRAAHQKVVEMIRPAEGTRIVPLCSHAEGAAACK